MEWEIRGDRTDSHSGQPRNVVLATVKEVEYHGEWMGDEYVSVTVKSAVPIDFHFNDTLTYRDETYYLCYDPSVLKKARRGSYGEGFTYDNIKFYSLGHKLKTTDFKDIVLEYSGNSLASSNSQVYTSLSEFSFFASSVEDLADRLQANLSRVDPTAWKVYTPDWNRCAERGCNESTWEEYFGSGASTYGETDVNVTVSKDDNCDSVLKKVYSDFGLPYYIKGYDVVIGAPAVRVGHLFRYGKGQGLYEIERTSDDDQEVVTKAWGYGSETNMPLNYYACSLMDVFASVTTVRGVWVDLNLTERNDKMFTIPAPAYGSGYFSVEFTVDDVTKSGLISYFTWATYSSYSMEIIGGNDLSVGDVVHFTKGVDKNAWPADHVYKDPAYPAALSINRLMLPGFPTQTLHDWVSTNMPSLLSKYIFSDDDPLDPWVMSKNAAVIGDYEGAAYFDGGNLKEIYPTIENTNSGIIFTGSTIRDNGYLSEGTDISFQIAVHKGSGYLDWLEALSTAPEDVYIQMTSGYCVGRSFKVRKAEARDNIPNVGSLWLLTCERAHDSGTNRYFPYFDNNISNYCQVQGNDTFVVTGIELPDIYIEAASEKLLIALCGWLDKRDHVRYTYVPRIDEIYMAKQDEAVNSGNDIATYGTVSLHDVLKAGMQMQFEDAADLGIERYADNSPYIDQLTIKEGGTPVPTYEVVLRDEKEKGALEKLAEKLADVTSQTTTPATERSDRDQTLQVITYDSWVQGTPYYYEAINAEGQLETSRVRRWGGEWECRRTGTTEEPVPGCQDWLEVVKCPVYTCEYDGWNGTTTYYYNSPNREETEHYPEGQIEISQVWLDWCLWECRRTGTTDAPSTSSPDWYLVRKEKSYNVHFSEYVDVITVDDVGNVIGGLYTVSGDEDEVIEYRIRSTITVRNHNDLLLVEEGLTPAGAGRYKIHAEPHGCTCSIVDSTIYITSIDHLKDGVASSSDDNWTDADYALMRQVESCSVDLVIDCEGEASIAKTFPVTIKHSSEPFITMDLSNQSSTVSWNSKRSQYVGLPISVAARTWHNDERVPIAALSDIGVTANEPGETPVPIVFTVDPQHTDQASGTLNGMTVVKRINSIEGVRTAVIRVTALGASQPLVMELNITCVVVYAGVRYERTLTHVLNKQLDANVYEILPVNDAVKGHYEDGVLTLNPSTLFVNVRCSSTNDSRNYLVSIDGSSTPSLSSLGFRLQYKRWKLGSNGQLVAQDVTEWNSYTTSGVPITSETRKVTFQLDEMDGSTVVHTHDVEEVPVVIDGSNAINVQLDNDNDTCMVLENGDVPDVSLLPVAYARLYDGEEPVDYTLIPYDASVPANNHWVLDCDGCTAVIDGWKSHSDYSWIATGDHWLRLHVTSLTADSATVRVCCTYAVDGVSEVYAKTLSIKKLYTVDKYDLVTTPKHICYTPPTDSYSADAILVDVYQTTQRDDKHKMAYNDSQFVGNNKIFQLMYSVDSGQSWTFFDYNYDSSEDNGQILEAVWDQDGIDNVHIRLLEKFSGEEGSFVWVERTTEVVDIISDGEGEPAFTGELSPVAGFFYVNADGIVEEEQVVETNVKLWLGEDSQQALTDLRVTTITTKTGGGVTDSIVSYQREVVSGVYTGKITFYIHVQSPSAATPGLIAYITATCGVGSKALRFMIEPIKRGAQGTPGAAGPAGADAVTYEVRSNVDQVTIPSNQSSSTLSATFTFWKKVGSAAATNTDTFHWGLYWRKGTTYSLVSGSDDYKASSKTFSGISTSKNNVRQDAFVLFINNSILPDDSEPTSYLAKCEVPILKNGDIGRMYYPAGEWDKDTEYEMTDALCPFVEYNDKYYYPIVQTPDWGSQSDNPEDNTAEWALCEQFGVVFTEALFSDFGKLGSSIFSGDYQFSQQGYMLGFDNEHTPIYNSSQYKNIDPDDVFGMNFPNNMPANAVGRTVGSSWESIYLYTDPLVMTKSVTLEAGKYYSLKLHGDGMYWQLCKENLGIMGDVIISGDLVLGVPIVRNFTVPTTGSYSVFGEASNGVSGSYDCYELAECKFVPNIVMDHLTGEAQMERLYLRAGFSRTMLDVTPTNYGRYVKTNVSQDRYLDMLKLCANIRLTSAWSSSGVTLPSIWLPDVNGMSDSEMNIVRGLSKQEFVVINESGSAISLTGNLVTYNSGAALPSNATLPSGQKMIVTCDYGFTEVTNNGTTTYGEEYVKWRVRITGSVVS